MNPEMLVGKKAVWELFQKHHVAKKIQVVLDEGHIIEQWTNFHQH
jgi:hypothetical protein